MMNRTRNAKEDEQTGLGDGLAIREKYGPPFGTLLWGQDVVIV